MAAIGSLVSLIALAGILAQAASRRTRMRARMFLETPAPGSASALARSSAQASVVSGSFAADESAASPATEFERV
jgi:hypothetical protein